MFRDPDELINETVGVFSPPDVYVRVSGVVNDPKSSLLDIANVVNADANLSVRLLKLANSALYNFPAKVETITHAITVIGNKQLLNLVLATSVLDQFKNISSGMVSMNSFWRHSIACGVTARVIAVYKHEINVERFYVMGLLHDIGQLIMFTKFPEVMKRVLKEEEEKKEPLHIIEARVVGFDHAAVGGTLMRHWKLPMSLEEALMFHHKPLLAVHYPVEAAIVHAADIIALAMELGTSGERYVPPVEMKAWDLLGLPDSLLSSIWEQVELQFNDTVSIFFQD